MTAKRWFLKRWFLQGIVVVSPFVLTGGLFYLVVVKADAALWFVWDKLLPNLPKPGFPGLGLLLVVSTLILAGLLTESWVIKHGVKFIDWILFKVPFVKDIYSTFHKVVQTVVNGHEGLAHPVYIEFPRQGCYAIGFVTGTAPLKDGEGVSVFVPTSPLPTQGFYLILPRDQIIETKLTTEEAFKLVISAGIVK